MLIEPIYEQDFLDCSYGFRPKRSAHDALQRLWEGQTKMKGGIVLELDIRKYFETVDHRQLQELVRQRISDGVVKRLLGKWLNAGVQKERRTSYPEEGVPQGGVISPVLSNIYLHEVLDKWFYEEVTPRLRGTAFLVRYADDVIVHCSTEEQARELLEAIRERLGECGLELHPTKTKIVYCKDDDRPGAFEEVKFDFLGYTFQPRRAKNRWGKHFVSFLPAISQKGAKEIRATIRSWRMSETRNNQKLEDLARLSNPVVRGWMNYYGRFYRSKCMQVLRYLNRALSKWVRRKYKDRFRKRERAAEHWLGRIAQRERKLFVLWQLGVTPAAGQ